MVAGREFKLEELNHVHDKLKNVSFFCKTLGFSILEPKAEKTKLFRKMLHLKVSQWEAMEERCTRVDLGTSKSTLPTLKLIMIQTIVENSQIRILTIKTVEVEVEAHRWDELVKRRKLSSRSTKEK